MKSKLRLFILTVLFVTLASQLFTQERFRRIPPLPDPMPPLELPEIQSAELSNGLKLSVVRQFHLPTVTIILTIMKGESSSPDHLPGLATLTAEMIDKGAHDLSASEIAEIKDNIGGTFSSETFPDYTVFTLSFLEDSLNPALQLLGDMILRPSFQRQELDNLKRTLFYFQARQLNDPSFIGRRLLYRILFKDHSYEKYIFTEDVIRNIERKDLVDFHDSSYRPNSAHLVLIGNLSLSAASRNVSRYLSSWRPIPVEYRQITPPPPNQNLRICFVDVPQVREALIYMGNLLPPKSSDDYFPLLVLNQVLGGRDISRLFMNLRESKEYAYWAYSSMEFFRSCGILSVRARVRAEVIHESIREILHEFYRISTQKIALDEIEESKANLIGNYALSLETQDRMASRISENLSLNLGTAHWNRYYESVMDVNSRQVAEVAGRLPLETPVVIIAGDKDVIIEHLKNFQEVEIYDLKGQFQYKMVRESQSRRP